MGFNWNAVPRPGRFAAAHRLSGSSSGVLSEILMGRVLEVGVASCSWSEVEPSNSWMGISLGAMCEGTLDDIICS